MAEPESSDGAMAGSLASMEAGGQTASSDAELVWTGGEDSSSGGDATHYYFPVEIEVRTAPAPIDADALVVETLRRLTEGIRGA